MAANNMLNPAADPSAEDAAFAEEIAALKRWWQDDRWRATRRPYTPEQIVSKRGSLKIEYPSNAQSKKLWSILEGRFKVSSSTAMLSCPWVNLDECMADERRR